MPHMVVTVDDEIRFDGEIADWQLPTRPEVFPSAVRAAFDPTIPPTPMAKLFMLTMFTQLIMSTLEDQRLQPLDVDMQLRGPGCFTLKVDTPAPGTPVLEVGDPNHG